MELLILFLLIIQGMGISIGVGSSTLAVLNFFMAIKDGVITELERNFMGITYHVLRVGMTLILVPAVLLAFIGYNESGSEYFTSYIAAQAVMISILFINSFLMTMRMMPSTFGPAIQAASWYTLGFIYILNSLSIPVTNILVFLFAYATFVFFAISFINAVMAYLKDQLENQKKATN